MKWSRGLVAVVLVAAALRVPSLLHDGIWRDEANVYVELTAATFGAFLHRVAAIDFHPPLYFILAYGWVKIAGLSEVSLKALPFVFSVATVPVVYRLGKAADSEAAGFVAATLFAVAPLTINYSTMYLYPLAILADGLLALAVTTARRKPDSALQYAAVFGATLLAVYSHYTGLILAAILAVWALWAPRGWKHGARLACTIVLGVLPFAFWLPVFLHQHHVGLPYQAPASFSRSAQAVTLALAQLVPVPPMPVAVALFVAVLAPGAVVALRTRGWQSDAFALGAVSICAILAVASTGLLVVRYVLPFCSLFYVCLAWLLTLTARQLESNDPSTWRRWRAPVTAVLTAALVYANTAYTLAETRLPRSGIRTFLTTVPVDPRTLYVIAPDYAAPEFAYYARDSGARFIGFARIDRPEIFVLDDYEAIWNDGTLVSKVQAAIASRAAQFRYLDVVVDDNARDQYHIPFSRVRQLITALQQQYDLVERRDYPGRWEPISVYRFRLTVESRAKELQGPRRRAIR
ncbi:MAG TPA: glycosyltransferase family 39 protein [Candidatus Baltobacteraceae bacterium]|nr:glycosyltransferase family 39 protein [Candidatus Baltobacteraceae bacterium]